MGLYCVVCVRAWHPERTAVNQDPNGVQGTLIVNNVTMGNVTVTKCASAALSSCQAKTIAVQVRPPSLLLSIRLSELAPLSILLMSSRIALPSQRR